MLLEEAKMLLAENNIPFELQEHQNEKEYWHHKMQFAYTDNAKECKVVAMIVKSNNGNKNIELQFNSVNNNFIFDDMCFGGFSYELFDIPEEELSAEMISIITEIMKGNLAIITVNNLKKKHLMGDACFNLNDDDNTFGKPGFEKAIDYIKKPQGFLKKFVKPQRQYEIYDWNTYQCIIK